MVNPISKNVNLINDIVIFRPLCLLQVNCLAIEDDGDDSKEGVE